MGALQIILGISGFLIVVGYLVYQLISKNPEKNVIVPINAPKIYFFSRTKFTDGYWEGSVIKERKNKNGTTLFEFAPGDVEQGEEVKMAEIQKIPISEESIIRNSQGDLSARRQTIFIIGRDKLELPRKMQETLLGDYISIDGQRAFMKKVLGEMVPNGDKAIEELMTHYSRGHPGSNIIGQYEEAMKKLIEITNMVTSQKDKEEGGK